MFANILQIQLQCVLMYGIICLVSSQLICKVYSVLIMTQRVCLGNTENALHCSAMQIPLVILVIDSLIDVLQKLLCA